MIGELIRAVRVEELFGLYTYNLPEAGKGFHDAAILYGDNGVGKTTILKLIFHILSPANNKGHRSALAKMPFKKFEVELTSGVIFRAVREGDSNSTSITLTIHSEKRTLAEWKFDPNNRGASGDLVDIDSKSEARPVEPFDIRRLPNGQYVLVSAKRGSRPKQSHPIGERPYLEELRRHAPTVFLLSADRRLDSDSVADPSDEVQLRRLLRYEDVKRVNDLVTRSREIALTQALSTASQWISKQAVQGANRGSTNVHGVYVNVLRHLGVSRQSEAEPADPASLLARLAPIETSSQALARYEFTPALSTADFRKALQTRAKGKRALAAELLKPYVESLERRLEALNPIYQLVDSFVSTVNGFLRDKSLTFSLSGGFKIKNRLLHDLMAPQLSSGEQQLLLLFCYVLVARDQPSVFIIDEPEISLNIKWQRRLVQSLLNITDNANIQFILASHSMELLAQHRGRVIQLESKNV